MLAVIQVGIAEPAVLPLDRHDLHRPAPWRQCPGQPVMSDLPDEERDASGGLDRIMKMIAAGLDEQRGKVVRIELLKLLHVFAIEIDQRLPP